MFRRPQPLRPISVVEPPIELSPDTLAVTADPAPTVLERSRTSIANVLDSLRRDEQTLVSEIAERERKLRETRLSIAGFEAAEETMAAGVERHLSSANTNGAHVDGPEAA